MYKILTIVGARPHFVKAAMVSRAIAASGVMEEVIVHTGQHYDHKLSQAFFDELQLPKPAYNLGVGSGPHVQQMGAIMIGLDEIIQKEKPDAAIVYGDTNSTAAGAIAASKNNVVLIHIESGLREFDKSIPEEINKLLTDAVTDIYFCPTRTGIENLFREGITANVHNVGDVGIDLIHHNLDKIKGNKAIFEKYKLKQGHYFFMTCHRAANTDDPEKLKEILSIFQHLEEDIIFPIHPRTVAAIQKFDLLPLVEYPNLILTEPLGFWDTQALIRYSRMVITDSGGVIKEAYYHKVPGIIVDTQTEWIESVDEGWNHIAGPSTAKILEIISTFEPPYQHSNCLGNGTASQQIVQIVTEYLNSSLPTKGSL